MHSDNLFEDFQWHSSIGLDSLLQERSQFVTSMPNNRLARSMFVEAGDSTLIHKTTRALWKISDDKASIVPMFSTDILTEEEVRQAMEEEGNES